MVDLSLPGTDKLKDTVEYTLSLSIDKLFKNFVYVGHDMGVHGIEVGSFEFALDGEEFEGGMVAKLGRSTVREMVRSVFDSEKYVKFVHF